MHKKYLRLHYLLGMCFEVIYVSSQYGGMIGRYCVRCEIVDKNKMLCQRVGLSVDDLQYFASRLLVLQGDHSLNGSKIFRFVFF